jgi:nucleotide-binding universal stress UspA family protein
MYKNILAAVNEYTNSEIAARYALALAKACHAKLTLLFVSRDPVDRDAIKKAESAIERLFIEAQQGGIDVESLILKGDPVKKIIEHAVGQKADIVFAASRHVDVHKRFFVKTVARELMLKLPCASAVVRVIRMGKLSPRNILLPLRGGRAFVEERAYFAAMLAEGFSSRVTLLHLPKPITSFFHGELHLKPAQREERIPADVLELGGYLKTCGIPYEIKTASGTTASNITMEAVQRKTDLIVMGASQRSILASLIKGNPVEEVMKSPPCNLIIFKPGRAS